MASTSIIGSTYDLLAFDHAGNFGKFDRCFSKAAQYLSVDMDDIMRRKLRNRAFYYLRTIGYLDVSHSKLRTEWTVSPPSLVQRGENDFVLIGGSNDEISMRGHAANKDLRVINSTENGLTLPPGVSFFPHVAQLIATEEEAKTIADRSGLSVSLFYQDKLFKCLPSIQTVFETVLIRLDRIAVFEPNSVKRLNLEKTRWEWEPYAEMRPLEAGLFRRQEFEYSPADYFLAVSTSPYDLEVFRVTDPEWAFVCFFSKLDIKLRVRYSLTEQKIFVSKMFQNFRIPSLLERCFRSGTLLAPEVIREWSIYSNIFYRNLWRLIAKYPVFEVELI